MAESPTTTDRADEMDALCLARYPILPEERTNPVMALVAEAHRSAFKVGLFAGSQRTHPSAGEADVERVAVALWIEEARRAAPNVVKYRNAKTFHEQPDSDVAAWLGMARAAIAALAQHAAPKRDMGCTEEDFLSAIHAATPKGEWIQVKHHPNGDWSVAAEPEAQHAAKAPVAWLIRVEKRGKSSILSGHVFKSDYTAEQAAKRLTMRHQTCTAIPVGELPIVPFDERVAYEDRILEAEMATNAVSRRAATLRSLIPSPSEPGGYAGDCFYPVGGTVASHRWDGGKWEWLV